MKEYSNYVAVNFVTMWELMKNHFIATEKDNHTYFSKNDLLRFFEQNCNLFLLSFGVVSTRLNAASQNWYGKYNKSFAKTLGKVRTAEFFDSPNIHLILDSGGYQIAEGRIDQVGMLHLERMYYSFIEEYSHLYSRAFILDFPPGPKSVAFSNFEEVYRHNLRSYLRAASLPDAIRARIIYVHHTRTPKLHEIFTKILRDNDLFSRFNHFATGSIASNYATDTKTPYFIYALPLVQLLNDAIKSGRKEFSYHVLGGATLRDAFTYEFVKYHIQKKHGITVSITFDGTNSLNPFLGRQFAVLGGENVLYPAKSTQFNRVDDNGRAVDRINEELSRFAKAVNFKEIQVSYREDGNWSYETSLYLLLYSMYVYKRIEIASIEKAKELYPIYESGDYPEFNRRIELVFRKLNAGKITRKHKAKFHALARTLDLLTSLDEDHCKYIITHHLGRTEFSNLLCENKILKI